MQFLHMSKLVHQPTMTSLFWGISLGSGGGDESIFGRQASQHGRGTDPLWTHRSAASNNILKMQQSVAKKKVWMMTNLQQNCWWSLSALFPDCILSAQTRPLLHLFDLLKLYSISCSSWNFGSHQCVLRLSLQRLQLLQIYTHKNPGKSKNSPKTKNQKAQH